jgi:hypothetical protein
MKRLSLISLAAALSVASTGCFTTWAGTRLAGKTGAWDEKVREENVPLPGVSERLVVALPLNAETFRLECHSMQNAKDAVYHTTYRYGSGWKKATGIMFLAEAALGAVLLATSANEKPGNVVLGGFLAADALGTGILFFAPRKEIYSREEKPVTTDIRSDCPDGLVLDIAGEQFPVDAAGRIGDIGNAAFDAWLEEGQPAPAPVPAPAQAGPYVPPAYGAPITQTAPATAAVTQAPSAPAAPLLISFQGKTQELGLGYIDRCVMNHARHPETAPCSSTNTLATAMFEVPVGTFGTVAAN